MATTYTWHEVLWLVMAQTQHGFRKMSTRRQPRRAGPRNKMERRADKVGYGSMQWLRRYRERYQA